MLRKLSFYSNNLQARANGQQPVDGKYADIPAEIVNFNGPASSIRKYTPHGDTVNKSNFLITVNPNVSYKLLDLEKRVALTRHLRAVMAQIGEKLKSREFLKSFSSQSRPGKQFGTDGAEVTKYDFTLEQGLKRGFIHSHAICLVNKKVHINTKAANEWLQNQFNDWQTSGKPYLHVRSFPSTESIMQSYLNKQQSDGNLDSVNNGANNAANNNNFSARNSGNVDIEAY